MQSEPERDPRPSPECASDLARAHRLAARLSGRPESRDAVVARALARIEQSRSERFCDELAHDLMRRFDRGPNR